MFTQIVLIAAIKQFLYNTIKNNAGIISSLEARWSWGGWRQACKPAHTHASNPKRGAPHWFARASCGFGLAAGEGRLDAGKTGERQPRWRGWPGRCFPRGLRTVSVSAYLGERGPVYHHAEIIVNVYKKRGP